MLKIFIYIYVCVTVIFKMGILQVVLSLMLLTCAGAQRRTLSDVEYYCGNKPADVVFLLDVSNSIWGPDFQKQLNFVNDVIDMFEVGENVTRVGIASFSSHVYREFHLDDYFDKESMKRAVNRIVQRQGYSTNTGTAIWHMRKRMFSERHGSRPGVAKVGIILTDGQSQQLSRTLYEAFRAKMQKIFLFAIGIGGNTNERELAGIATDPENFMFKVEGYSALDAIKSVLAIRTCRVTTPTTTTSTTTTTTTTTTPSTTTSLYDVAAQVCADRKTDVIFALDSSDSVGDVDYVKQADFVKDIVRTFDISPNKTRVGSILYSDQIEQMFNLEDHTSVHSVRKALDKLGMTAGSNRVDLAMKHILTKGFRRSTSRDDAAHVGVIITASPSRYLELSKHMNKRATHVGVEYIAIGVGTKVDAEELQVVAGADKQHIFQVDSFEELMTYVPEIAMQICRVPAPAVPIKDQACGRRQEADIMFLMDSVNAGRRNTQRSLAFLKALVEELDIDHDNIHVGLMSAECLPDNPGFHLNTYSTKHSIQMAVESMKVMDFHDIIHQMRRKAFEPKNGARKHAKKIAILIIDGSLEEPLKTLKEAQRAKIHGVEVFVIQVGDEEPQEEVLMMCDDPTNQHFYKVKDYKELLELKDRLLASLCDEL